MITANFPSNPPLAAAFTVGQGQGSVRSGALSGQNKNKLVRTKQNPISEVLTSSVDKESVARRVDVVARVHVGNKDACTRIRVE